MPLQCERGSANETFDYNACVAGGHTPWTAKREWGRPVDSLLDVSLDFGPAVTAPSDVELFVSGWPRFVSLEAQLRRAKASPPALTPAAVGGRPPTLVRALPYFKTLSAARAALVLERSHQYHAALGLNRTVLYVKPKDVMEFSAHPRLRAMAASGALTLVQWDELAAFEVGAALRLPCRDRRGPAAVLGCASACWAAPSMPASRCAAPPPHPTPPPWQGWRDFDLYIQQSHAALSHWGRHARVLLSDADEFVVPNRPGDTLPAMLGPGGCLAGLRPGPTCYYFRRRNIFPPGDVSEAKLWEDPGPNPLRLYTQCNKCVHVGRWWWGLVGGGDRRASLGAGSAAVPHALPSITTHARPRRHSPCALAPTCRLPEPKALVLPERVFPISVHYSGICAGTNYTIADGSARTRLRSPCTYNMHCSWVPEDCAYIAHATNMVRGRAWGGCAALACLIGGQTCCPPISAAMRDVHVAAALPRTFSCSFPHGARSRSLKPRPLPQKTGCGC